jgi:UDP-N-acetylmuramoyl-tripeptide--D-alanyl-D-alanine ligase
LTVNDDLKKTDEILIVEMGARRAGEIRELCDFIRPDYCVITAIGEQHLSTFGSVARIYEEKTSISWGGEKATFFNVDNPLCAKAAREYGEKAVVSGANADGFDSEKAVRYLVEGAGKMRLSGLVSGEYEYDLPFSYAPSLISLALAVAGTLNVCEELLKSAVKSLKGVAHRQQILYNGNDVIIDDSYNSNPQGFLSALSLLGKFDKVRVIITPGVVEGGKNSRALNSFLGEKAAKVCDYALVYGPNAKALQKGGGDKAKVFRSLKECMDYYSKIQGDRAVLFENDLPDVMT